MNYLYWHFTDNLSYQVIAQFTFSNLITNVQNKSSFCRRLVGWLEFSVPFQHRDDGFCRKYLHNNWSNQFIALYAILLNCTNIDLSTQLDGCIVWSAHNTSFGLKPYRLATIHQGYRHTDRTDRQRSDSAGQNVLQTVPKNQLIAKHDMTYVTRVIWVFRQSATPTSLVPNHATTPMTTHFHYVLLRWLHHKTTLLAIFPCHSFLAIFLAYNVHQVSMKFAIRCNVIPSHNWCQSISRPTGNK